MYSFFFISQKVISYLKVLNIIMFLTERQKYENKN